MGRVGHGAFTELLDEYADAAEQVARADLGYVDRRVAGEERGGGGGGLS